MSRTQQRARAQAGGWSTLGMIKPHRRHHERDGTHRIIPDNRAGIVTAHMAAPVVADFGLPLDSIIVHCCYFDVYGSAFYTLPDPTEQPLHLPDDYRVPLARYQFNTAARDRHGKPGWLYMASWSDLATATEAETLTAWSKRIDARAMTRYTNSTVTVNDGSGRYKNYRTSVFVRYAPRITWRVYGDLSEIARLLSTYAITIGKKGAQGWGWVRGWEVAQAEQDHSLWQPSADGAATTVARAIPLDYLPPHTIPPLLAAGCRQMFCGYRPPYWEPRNQALCLVPPAPPEPEPEPDGTEDTDEDGDASVP